MVKSSNLPMESLNSTEKQSDIIHPPVKSRGNLKVLDKIPVEITARHLHLCARDADKLFGKNYQFKKLKDISQPGQFACQETLKLVGPKQTINNLRIVGPLRVKTQIELTLTEVRNLGVNAQVSVSGESSPSSKIILVGPKAKLKLKNCLIIPQRHLHFNDQEAKRLKLKNGQLVSIKVGQERQVTFHQVIVRSGPKHCLAVHLDTDEANAAGLKSCSYGELIK